MEVLSRHLKANNMANTIHDDIGTAGAANYAHTTSNTGGSHSITSGSYISSHANVPEADIEKILEKVYKLGFEHGNSAMERLLRGEKRNRKSKKKFKKLKEKLFSLFRANVLYVPSPPSIPQDPYPGIQPWTAGYDSSTTNTAEWNSDSSTDRKAIEDMIDAYKNSPIGG